MATVRQHLQDLHKRLAEHHEAKHAHHKKMSSHYVDLGTHLGKTESSKGARDTLEAMAAAHDAMVTEHAAAALFHTQAAEDCAKAADAADLGKRGNDLVPLPEGFRRVAPAPPNLTAVPRIGSAPLQRPAVPQEFEKAYSVEDEERDLYGRPVV